MHVSVPVCPQQDLFPTVCMCTCVPVCVLSRKVASPGTCTFPEPQRVTQTWHQVGVCQGLFETTSGSGMAWCRDEQATAQREEAWNEAGQALFPPSAQPAGSYQGKKNRLGAPDSKDSPAHKHEALATSGGAGHHSPKEVLAKLLTR